MTQIIPSIGRRVNYSYERDTLLNRWITHVPLNGSGTYSFGSDAKGRTAQVSNPLGQVTTRRFSKADELLQELRPNGANSSYSYTGRGWLAAIEHRKLGGNIIDQLQYFYTDSAGQYDPTGRLRREVDAAGRTHEYSYDLLGRLISESHPDFGTVTYSLDKGDNRLSRTINGATEWLGYDWQNKLLWTNQGANAPPVPGQAAPYRLYTYDVNGQPTDMHHRDTPGGGVTHDKLFWDGMGKLRRLFCVGAAQERYTAEYDFSGTRIKSRQDGVDHLFSYGAGLLHDSDEDTLYTPGISERRNGTHKWYHSDRIGSTRYTSAVDGTSLYSIFRYSGFGETTSLTGNPIDSSGFAGAHGYQSDAPMGLQLLGQRYYDPYVGRFLNPDPIGLPGGFNLYGYCYGDPVNLVDPDGLDPFLSDEMSADDITHFGGRGTLRLISGAFHRRDMKYANKVHERIGYGRFKSGNRPLGQDLLDIHATFGAAGAGGPAMRGASAASKACAGSGPTFFQRLGTNWHNRFSKERVYLKNLPTPNGIKPAAFGKITKWGSNTYQAALDAKAFHTRESLQAAGVTYDMARAWRDGYRNAVKYNKKNMAAWGRIQLMEHIMKLLR